jgi:phage terminase large subunit-like protein
VGCAEDGTVYVIADETAGGLTPAGWSRRAIALWRRLSADALVVEVNQGGDMVRAVIGEADDTVPVVAVRARRGKWLRAEPVSALYEQGRVKHAGVFPALEDEMCDFVCLLKSFRKMPLVLQCFASSVLVSISGGQCYPPLVGAHGTAPLTPIHGEPMV